MTHPVSGNCTEICPDLSQKAWSANPSTTSQPGINRWRCSSGWRCQNCSARRSSTGWRGHIQPSPGTPTAGCDSARTPGRTAAPGLISTLGFQSSMWTLCRSHKYYLVNTINRVKAINTISPEVVAVLTICSHRSPSIRANRVSTDLIPGRNQRERSSCLLAM